MSKTTATSVTVTTIINGCCFCSIIKVHSSPQVVKQTRTVQNSVFVLIFIKIQRKFNDFEENDFFVSSKLNFFKGKS